MEKTLTEPLKLNFSSGISPIHAERAIELLGEDNLPTRPLLLQFTGYPYVNAGAGWRIGNALRRFSGKRLEVHVPPIGTGDWFRTFTRSGLGVAIATHAGKVVCEGEDVTTKIQELYLKTAIRRDQNAVFFGDLHKSSGVNADREDLFRESFLTSLRKVNVRPTNFDPDRLRDLIKMTFEGIQNVYDHAAKKPLPVGSKIVSYFLLGYYKTVKGHPDPTGRLRGYEERLVALTSRSRTDFVQVCVNDDGAGIAARQSQDPDIYRGSLESEETAVRDALKTSSSVKLRAQDCRVRGVSGFGYTYIGSCLRSLRALAVLRTGRLLAYLDGTDEARESFEFTDRELGYMPGTSLDVLIPILREGDGQPTFFSE